VSCQRLYNLNLKLVYGRHMGTLFNGVNDLISIVKHFRRVIIIETLKI
jgi:hypothetical protein